MKRVNSLKPTQPSRSSMPTVLVAVKEVTPTLWPTLELNEAPNRILGKLEEYSRHADRM